MSESFDGSTCKTLSLKTATWLAYCGAELIEIKPVEVGPPGRYYFHVCKVPPGVRSAPADGELVELALYTRTFDKLKNALTAVTRGVRGS